MVLEREKEIRKMRAAGMKCQEIADKLGVCKQRVYNFFQQCKRREANDGVFKGMAEQKELRRKKVWIDPGWEKPFAEVYRDIEEVLSRSTFYSRCYEKAPCGLFIFATIKMGTRWLRSGDTDAALALLRRTVARAALVLVSHRRTYAENRDVIGHQWMFSFTKY